VALDVGELVAHLRVGAEGMARGLRDGESRFRQFGDKMTTLAAGAGLAAATAFGAAIFANMSQDNVGAKIAAQLGDTAESAKSYGAMAGRIYAQNWGESVEAIGDTLQRVIKAGISPDETDAAIEATVIQAQTLADVFDQDVGSSIKAVQQLIATGLVPDATAGFDLITAGIQGGLDESDDLLDTVNEYSTLFRELGLSGSQAFGLIQQGMEGGARDSDIAADALKEFSIRSKDASTTSAEGFKAIGLDAKEMTAIFAKGGPEAAKGLDTVLDNLRAMKDPVAQNAAAVALFGTQSEDLGKALYSMDLNTISAEFDNSAGAIKRAGDAVGQTDSAKIEGFKRSAMAAAQALAADLVPSLSEAGGWIKKNEAWIKPLALTLGGLAVAIVAVNLATKAWMATEKAFTAVKAAGTAMQWLFNAALWASPITWIIIGILALIAVIVLIATKTDWFQKAWNWAWGGIKAGAAAVWDWIKGTLWPGIQAVWGWLVRATIATKDGIVSAWNGILSYLNEWKNRVAGVFSAIGDFIAAGFNRGRDAARNAINAVIGFVNGALGAINGLINMANKVPGVNIPTIGSIPRLAGGGTVMPNGRRGTPVIMGDGGEVEYGIPKSDMRSIIAEAVGAASHSGRPSEVILRMDFGRFRKAFQGEVSRRGGSADVVLSPGRA
jgi:TP901 family phage tail tape measure protein